MACVPPNTPNTSLDTDALGAASTALATIMTPLLNTYYTTLCFRVVPSVARALVTACLYALSVDKPLANVHTPPYLSRGFSDWSHTHSCSPEIVKDMVSAFLEFEYTPITKRGA